MKILSIADLVSRHRRIALYSNVLIHLFEGTSPAADQAGAIVDAVESGLVQGTFATVGLTEVLTRPAQLGGLEVVYLSDLTPGGPAAAEPEPAEPESTEPEPTEPGPTG